MLTKESEFPATKEAKNKSKNNRKETLKRVKRGTDARGWGGGGDIIKESEAVSWFLYFKLLSATSSYLTTERKTERQTYSQIARESREVKTLNTVSNERIKAYILRKREMKRDMDGQAD